MKKDSGYFHPACFQILFKRNWFKTSLSCPLTVTFPDLSGCLNCRWSPLVVSSIHLPLTALSPPLLYIFSYISFWRKGNKNNTIHHNRGNNINTF